MNFAVCGSESPPTTYRTELLRSEQLLPMFCRRVIPDCASAPTRAFAPARSRPASVVAMGNGRADALFRARVEDAIERDDPAELADLAFEVGLAGEPWD